MSCFSSVMKNNEEYAKLIIHASARESISDGVCARRSVSMRGAGFGSTLMVSVTTTLIVSYIGVITLRSSLFRCFAAIDIGAHKTMRTSNKIVLFNIIP